MNDSRELDILRRAFRDAVRAFAQYAEDTDDVPEETVDNLASGFMQNAMLACAVARLAEPDAAERGGAQALLADHARAIRDTFEAQSRWLDPAVLSFLDRLADNPDSTRPA